MSTVGAALPFVNVSGNSSLSVSLMRCGGSRSCARLTDGRLKCWGRNDGTNGLLGLGDTNNRGDNAGEMGDNLPAIDLGTGLSVVDFAAGNGHTCAIVTGGRLKCWG